MLILSDDHAAQAISAYGSRINSTPRIDEIASRGARLDNCFATNALCSPSRASILTGTYSHINGVTTLETPIDASQPTFVSQLRAAGYRTGIVGKWHMGDGPGHDPEGFDYWDVILEQGEYWNPQFLSPDGLRPVEGYATDVMTDLALEWVDQLDEDQPWCLLLFHKAPHRPWEPHPRHMELYRDPIDIPATFEDDYASRTASTRRAAMRIADNLTTTDLKEDVPEGLSYQRQTEWKYQRFMSDYLRCVAAVDESVGRVTDWLAANGQFEDTVLMYSSDQGFFLGEHGWFDKRFMYEESLRMPFVISYPRAIAAGTVHPGIVTNVDLARTLLEAAGVEPHPRMQGTSFWGALTGDATAPVADGVYYRYWENGDVFHNAPAHYGYRTQRYKLIYYYNDGLGLPGTGVFSYPPEWELYDLASDRSELRNVYDDPAYRAVREALKIKLWLAQAAVDDEPHVSQPMPPGVSEHRDASQVVVPEPCSAARL